jgi:hypothetical protein
MAMTQKLEWTDHDKDWVDIKPGWHEHKINLPEILTQPDFVNWYSDKLDWLYKNVDNCEQHCRWMFDDGKFCIKFRYERDYLLCVLRW